MAYTIYTQSCSLHPYLTSWLGLGIAALRLDLYEESERALEFANTIDPYNAAVWGYLTLVNLHQGDHLLQQAHRTLKQVRAGG